jgi:geranylgeranyl pyrophosphate synthase
MKAAKETAPQTTLLQLITRSFIDGDDPDTATASQVPHVLWEQALLRPLRDFLRRPGKGFRARLVELGYHLGGGIPGTHPPELPLVVESLHAGSLIVDDIEDDSDLRRDAATLHRVYGVPVALNAGNWLYCWPQVLLSRMPLTDEARLRAHERVAECLMRGHQGQALDLTVRVDELPQAEVPAVVDAIARLKTGSLLGLATALGAIAAGAPPERLDAIDRFGRAVGVGLQMLDDLSGVVSPARRHKALEDLQHGRATWVWAWLARDLDASAYQSLRAALQGRSIGGAMESLVGRLRFRLGTRALQRVRSHLRRATDALRDAIGDGGWVDDVRNELSWLESHFLEAGHAPAARAVRQRSEEASRGRAR